MDAEFWHERWRLGQIGFHRPDFHPALLKVWPDLGVAAASRVLVPLCGRSLDMRWLAQRGHAVLGVELSPIAIAAFFAHEALQARQSAAGPFTRHAAGRYSILQGDFFDLSGDIAADLGGFYDRAALVALPPSMRSSYARQLAQLLAAGRPGLLLTHEYPQEKMAGPPFSVPVAEVRELFSPAFEVELLSRGDVIEGNPRFRERGLDSIQECVFRLSRR